MKQTFYAIDTNKDGLVSPNEVIDGSLDEYKQLMKRNMKMKKMSELQRKMMMILMINMILLNLKLNMMIYSILIFQLEVDLFGILQLTCLVYG